MKRYLPEDCRVIGGNTRINPNPSRLQVGDKVQTDFGKRGTVVRTITRIQQMPWFGCKIGASATGGICECCEYETPDTGMIDATWFIPAEGENSDAL